MNTFSLDNKNYEDLSDRIPPQNKEGYLAYFSGKDRDDNPDKDPNWDWGWLIGDNQDFIGEDQD